MDNDLIENVLKLENWAVVGATIIKDKYGYMIFRRLLDKQKNVFPISPKYEEVDGVKAYKSIKEVNEKIDVVNFVVNPEVGIEVVKQCKELGIKYIWLQPGTVSEEILKYAKENDIVAIEACVLVTLR